MLRQNRRQAKLTADAHFEAERHLEDIDYSFNPSLDREKIDELSRLGFIEACGICSFTVDALLSDRRPQCSNMDTVLFIGFRQYFSFPVIKIHDLSGRIRDDHINSSTPCH